MPKYCFALASDADDKALREIMRSTPMEGSIRISFQKEPHFFSAERIGALDLQVIVGREQDTGRVIGFGSRSMRKVFVNGKPSEVGYLSSLRTLPEVRGGTLLVRAYRALREFHSDGRVPFYFTTIFDGNTAVKELLTSRRAGLPVYREVGVLDTCAINLASRPKRAMDIGIKVMRGSKKLLGGIVEFLNRYNQNFQFAPSLEERDFTDGIIFPGLAVENFHIARIGEDIIGTAAVWDQNSLKQTAVAGYSGMLKYFRPIYNLSAPFTGNPTLPKAGEAIRSFYISFVASDPVNPKILESILYSIHCDWRGKGFSYAIIGLNEKDPLKAALEGFHSRIVRSRVYVVFWKDGEYQVNELDGRSVNLEISTL